MFFKHFGSNKPKVDFDPTKEFMKHKGIVVEHMLRIVEKIRNRAINHDNNRMVYEERKYADKLTINLNSVSYESEDFNKAVEPVREAMEIHYKICRHHPEHFENGIVEMNLVDIVEMVCDWMAYAEGSNSDIMQVVELKQKKYNFSDDLKQIIINTIKDSY